MKKLYTIKREDGDEQRCNGCGWRVRHLYVLAESAEEAIKLYRSGDGGLCGDCMCLEVLSEGVVEVAD